MKMRLFLTKFEVFSYTMCWHLLIFLTSRLIQMLPPQQFNLNLQLYKFFINGPSIPEESSGLFSNENEILTPYSDPQIKAKEGKYIQYYYNSMQDNATLEERRIRSSIIKYGVLGVQSSPKNVTKKDKIRNFSISGRLRFWIDLPNSFPWRYCLQEYNDFVTFLPCRHLKDQQFLVTFDEEDDEELRLNIKLRNGDCVIPSSGQVVLGSCLEGSSWKWTEEGQLEWIPYDLANHIAPVRMCLTCTKENKGVYLRPCIAHMEFQYVELGVFSDEDFSQLLPLDTENWKIRQERLRNKNLALYKEEVTRTLKEIEGDENRRLGLPSEGNRRAVVFYVPNGQQIEYLRWWIYTWNFIGLSDEKQAFDIILFANPEVSKTLVNYRFKFGTRCVPFTRNFSAVHSGEGRCVVKQYRGISERDSTIDGYMNSIDCNSGPGTEFLEGYRMLLRADIDTFPTPKFLDFWPDQLLINRVTYGTTFYLPIIENLLVDTASAAGIEHKGWFNLGSSWYGETWRIRGLSKLTMSLYKFAKTYMFGPGTLCRCAGCSGVRRECGWGEGPYSQVMCLYLQEMAANRLWTQHEFDSQSRALLDLGTTDRTLSVCQPALLHAMHNAEPFSKFAFLLGKYQDFNMSELDITNTRDYAQFMALASTDQGIHLDVALRKGEERLGGLSWTEYCNGN